MPDREVQTISLTPNQIVAYNLRRARELRGWTMEVAAEHLEPYLGTRWSKATFSAAERSLVTPDRIRQFTADDLVAFAQAFGLPVTWFLIPPEPDLWGQLLPVGRLLGAKTVEMVHEGVTRRFVPTIPMPELVELVLGAEGVKDRLTEIFGDENHPGYPPEQRTRTQNLAGELAGFTAAAAMRATISDLPLWGQNLRGLADMLDAVHEEVDRKSIALVEDLKKSKKRGPKH